MDGSAGRQDTIHVLLAVSAPHAAAERFLTNNTLTTLPAGVFEDLTALETL